MSWPTPQDYNEAFQNPRLNFDDADLKGGTPDVTPLGLPRPITGGFASVYRVRAGSRQWAVRCFLRDFPDHQERYAQIGRHLAAAKIPYTVGFHFLDKGVRIRGVWYPLLKMEWIEGATFREAIEAGIQSPQVLAGLAERWIAMLQALKQHGIAHGDLQHGNVLICNGDFRLIDYDGMFVPALAGRTSHEVGHRNYQHPARVESDFGPHLDNFSGWVIYLSLIALSMDASLWGRFGGGDEHLLFRKEDFEEPRFSRLFRMVQFINDDRIQKYVPLLRSYLGMRLLSIASPADVIGVRPKRRSLRAKAIPVWSQDQQPSLFSPQPQLESAPVQAEPVAFRSAAEPVLSAASAPGAEPEAVTEVPLQAVVAPHEPLTAPDLVDFPGGFVGERVLLGSYGAFIVAIVGLAARGTIPSLEAVIVFLAGVGCLAVCLTFSYVTLPEVRIRVRMWFTLEWKRMEGSAVRGDMARLASRKRGLDEKESAEVRRLQALEVEVQKAEQDRIVRIREALSACLSHFSERMERLEKEESAEVARELERLVARHDATLEDLKQLAAVPEERLDRRGLKRLAAVGKRLEALRAAGPPRQISPALLQEIQQRYAAERLSLMRSKAVVRLRARNRIEGLRNSTVRRRERLRTQASRTCQRFDKRRQRLQRRVATGTDWLRNRQVDLDRRRAEINGYRQIRFTRYVGRVLGIPF